MHLWPKINTGIIQLFLLVDYGGSTPLLQSVKDWYVAYRGMADWVVVNQDTKARDYLNRDKVDKI